MNPLNPQETCSSEESWPQGFNLLVQECNQNPFSASLSLLQHVLGPGSYQPASDLTTVSSDGRPGNNESFHDSAIPPCISQEEFNLILKKYLKEPRERMMTEEERSNAIAVLQDPNNTSLGTPAYRHKIRREYDLEKVGGNGFTLRYKNGKKVLVNEEIYDVFLKGHQDTGHGGQRATCDKAKEEYENVKQELATLFVKKCNCPKANKNRNTARKRKYEGSEPPPPAKNKRSQRLCIDEFLNLAEPQIENLRVLRHRVLRKLEISGDALKSLLLLGLDLLLSDEMEEEFGDMCYNIIALPITMAEEEHDPIGDCVNFLSELNVANDGVKTSDDIRSVIKEKLSAIEIKKLQDGWDTINAEMKTMADNFEKAITEHWRETKEDDLNCFQERLRELIFDI